MGWTLVDDVPERPPKFVTIGAPHTTNWDLPIAILMFVGLGMKRNWVGKHTLFRPPLGWLMRALGGVPLDRSKRHNFVDQVVAAFGDEERTGRVISKVQRDGICWCGGTTWRERPAMRISVSSWATTDADVELSVKAILDAYRSCQ